MSDTIPDGWVLVELGNHAYIAGRIGWRGLKAQEYTEGGPILLSVPNLNHGDIVDFLKVNHISQLRYEESPEIQLKKGDILLVKDGAGIGKVGYVERMPGPSTVNSSLLVIRPNDPLISDRYLFYYLKGPQFQEVALRRITGSATPHLFQKDIKLLRVAVPPMREQQRIGEKVQKLLGRVESCQQRLAYVSLLLSRFRQSTLAAAFSGRLTADWRKENTEIETGAELIDRIRGKRTALARSTKEKNQINEAFDAGVSTMDYQLGIPDSWIECQIGAIATVVNGSTPSRKNASFWSGDIPWVSSGEVRNNIITATREQITKAGYENSSVRMLPPGTVLLAMIGEGKTRGQAAVLKIDATVNQNVAAVMLTHGLVESIFLWRWFQLQYEATRERGSGSGPQALNCQRVRELPFVLPPLAEQREIVRRVEALFVLSDRIEGRYKEARRLVGRISESILAKAFRGELVRPEAELAEAEGGLFESAEELLNRIEHSNRAETSKEPRRRLRRAKRAAV